MMNEGYPIKSGSLISESDFLNYRYSIDQQQPITKELLALGIHLLPKYLQSWAIYKQTLEELKHARKYRLNLNDNERQSLELQQLLSIDEIFELLQQLALPLTRYELMKQLQIMRAKFIVLQHVLRINARKKLSQNDYPFVLAPMKTTTHVTESMTTQLPQLQSQSQPQERLVTEFTEEEQQIESHHLKEAPEKQVMAWLLSLPRYAFPIHVSYERDRIYYICL
jgi:hypothetical protein